MLFAVLGVTVVRIGQLLSEHLFVGLVRLGPVHVLGHLGGMPTQLRAVRHTRAAVVGPDPGGGGRTLAVGGSLAAGLILALVLLT